MELRKFLNKKVKIIDKEGFTWKGLVSEYTSAIDSDENIENIDVIVDENNKFNTKGCYEFSENEIAEIEEIQ